MRGHDDYTRPEDRRNVVLALQCDHRRGIRTSSCQTEDEVVSLLRELEVIWVLRKKPASTVWKPKVEGAGGRSPDLGVPLLTARQTKRDREADGAVASPERRKLFLEEIDVIASMGPRGGMALEVLGVLMNGDRKLVAPQEIEETLKSRHFSLAAGEGGEQPRRG